MYMRRYIVYFYCDAFAGCPDGNSRYCVPSLENATLADDGLPGCQLWGEVQIEELAQVGITREACVVMLMHCTTIL